MAALPLADLPDGSDVFIDANIFIYALTSQSTQAREFLARCSREQVYGVTLFEIVNEATHQFMVAEALEKGHITRRSASELAERPEVVRSLTGYWLNTIRVLDLNLLLLSTEEDVVRLAHGQRQAAGLLTNDSMIVACMSGLGITRLASNDRAFQRVPDIEVYSPTDLT